MFPIRTHNSEKLIANLLAAIPEQLWWLFGTGYLGANAVLAIDLDCETIGNTMLMVAASGTAALVEGETS
jgi:hypothetical protein